MENTKIWTFVLKGPESFGIMMGGLQPSLIHEAHQTTVWQMTGTKEQALSICQYLKELSWKTDVSVYSGDSDEEE